MSDLITDFPALLNYWDFDKNIKIDVEKITITSKNTLTGNVLPVLMNGKQVHQNLIRIFKIIQKSVQYVSLEKCS